MSINTPIQSANHNNILYVSRIIQIHSSEKDRVGYSKYKIAFTTKSGQVILERLHHNECVRIDFHSRKFNALGERILGILTLISREPVGGSEAR